MSRGGFDPNRVGDAKREASIIPQILSSGADEMAKGFTEIKVVGLGGAGTNTIDRMIETGVQGIDFIAVNSDVQSLNASVARKHIQIGERITGGRGSGGDPRIGERAAEGAEDAIAEALGAADMVFITAGLGGGIGTGAAPIVARIAQRSGALTVGIVSLPFSFEGKMRRAHALGAVDALRRTVDSLIVVSNDRLLEVAPANLGIASAFRMADETLNQGIHGITDLILTPGLINLDFADVRTVMQRAGTALMATGAATGPDRAERAASAALTSPLLETSLAGARGILLNLTGGPDLTLHEVNEAAMLVTQAAAPDANIIFGAVVHPRLNDEVRVTVIAAGFDTD